MCITINELTLIDKFVDINLGSTNLELYIFHITKKLGNKKMMFSSHKLANFFLLVLVSISDTANATGLSIKLIHKHSTDSPFYPGNLTETQRIKLHVQSASAYATWLSNITSSSSTIRPRLKNQNLMYLVETGIGTFPPPRPRHYSYFLHFDTASDITWTQCEDCRRMGPRACFLQVQPLFPARYSKTYRPIPCGSRHPLCFPGECINKTCSYDIEYADGARTTGYLASESLTFRSDKNNKSATVQGFVLGCGIKNLNFNESSRTNVVAGNFGMGPGEHSFLRQKKSITRGRFSYCLPPLSAMHRSNVFLRFGDDIKPRKGLKETPLSTDPDFAFYFVELKGISVAEKRVDIPESMFARDEREGRGGCILDSGSAVTIMPPPVYDKVKAMLMKNHLWGYRRTRNVEDLDSCYLFPRNRGLKDLPNITFHLQGADLELPPRLAYITGKRGSEGRYLCLAMMSMDMDTYGLTVIGAQQQANTRFIFDTMKQKLYFGAEDCM